PTLAPEFDRPSESADRLSQWFLLEIRPNSDAEEFLLYFLTASLTDALAGLRYSARCQAQSMPEALAEFAYLGRCDRALYLRLLVNRTIG
ncbi:hypothetical protein C7B76_26865, partial [filamentous cyanobacterium CCP2]